VSSFILHEIKNMKKFIAKKILFFILCFAGAVLLFGAVVMGLWNAILPAVLGVKAITFLQALGILLLSKILFGGFGGRRWGGGRGHEWKQKMKQKWEHMTPDEKEKFKAEWKDRCGNRWRRNTETSETAVD
jgi:hypothetical protein